MAIIVTSNLSKKFKDLLAVDNVSLEVEEGECFGLLGPNGAGKTSLIRMITAVSPPLSGDIGVAGIDLRSHPRQVKAMLGIVPQIDNLDEDLTVLQNLTTFARYFGIPKAVAHTRGCELLRLLRLEEKSSGRIKELSGGMRRLLLIARGLVNQPRIAILDEPTVGLDPQTRHLVWQQLTELKAQGVTQLLCTQNMEEAAVLCDRVAVMHRGRILSLDSPQALIARHVGETVLEVAVTSANRERVVRELTTHGIDFLDVGNTVKVLGVNREQLPATLLGTAEELRLRPATLEDVFFRLTGKTLEGEEEE
ncbi:MAG: ABC transporter ATP-binding protein [Dehalococcoidales bacterium]|nr:MAG: ABC transporter ATP-binding protein [Dehalococcoidales bacterium]